MTYGKGVAGSLLLLLLPSCCYKSGQKFWGCQNQQRTDQLATGQENKSTKREKKPKAAEKRSIPSSITNAEAHLIPAAAYTSLNISIKAYRSLLPV